MLPLTLHPTSSPQRLRATTFRQWGSLTLTAMSTAMPTKQTFTACCCCCCSSHITPLTEKAAVSACASVCVCVCVCGCADVVRVFAAAATMKLIINYPASQPASPSFTLRLVFIGVPHFPPSLEFPTACGFSRTRFVYCAYKCVKICA